MAGGIRPFMFTPGGSKFRTVSVRRQVVLISAFQQVLVLFGDLLAYKMNFGQSELVNEFAPIYFDTPILLLSVTGYVRK
jgi:hypothetical protein